MSPIQIFVPLLTYKTKYVYKRFTWFTWITLDIYDIHNFWFLLGPFILYKKDKETLEAGCMDPTCTHLLATTLPAILHLYTKAQLLHSTLSLPIQISGFICLVPGLQSPITWLGVFSPHYNGDKYSVISTMKYFFCCCKLMTHLFLFLHPQQDCHKFTG